MKIKKYFIPLFIGYLSIFLLSSCSDEQFESINNSKNNNINIITYDNGINSNAKMLEFSDTITYKNTFLTLRDQVKNHINQFSTSNINLTDEQINNLADSLQFNEDEPLLNFEKTFSNYISMRKEFRNAESLWLQDSILEDDNSPFNEYLWSLYEMTLLNQYGEVKIGNSIMKIMKNGYIFIVDGDLTTLQKFNKGDRTVLNQPNVKSLLTTDSADCAGWKNKTAYHNYKTNYYVKYRVCFYSGIINVHVGAELYSYKLKNSGWRRFITKVGSDIDMGQIFDRDCNLTNIGMGTLWDRERSSHVDAYDYRWGTGQGLRIKTQVSVCGHFEYNGYSSYLKMAW